MGFSLKELVLAHRPYSSRCPVSSDHLCQPPSPAHSAAASRGHAAFTALQVLFGRPTTHTASLPTSLSAYRVAYPGATRKPHEFSWGHAQIFRTVPSANTLVRWVDENAFASIVQARPCPIFGRPVHHGVAPSITARYFSSCPSDSTSRWTPCPPVVLRQSELRSIPLAVSAVSSFVPV